MYRLEKASDIIDSVIDTMLEVGNGVTIDHIIEARRDLFEARDIIDDYVDKPTSYDVEKVVDQLQNMSNSIPLQYECNYKQGISDGLDKAIEVVKKGYDGTDDVCEWKGKEKEYIQNPHTKRLYSNEESMENVYCNTCGKKIKVVE